MTQLFMEGPDEKDAATGQTDREPRQGEDRC